MRIVQVSDCFFPRMGGIETQVSRLSTQLAKWGHEVVVLTATASDSQRGFERPWDTNSSLTSWLGEATEQTFAGPQLEASVQVIRSGWENPLGLPVDPRAVQRFSKYILEQRPDVVNFHMGELTPVVMGVIAALRSKNVASVVTIHSVWSNGPTVFGYRAGANLLGLGDSGVLWAPVSELVAKNVRKVVGSGHIRILGNGVDQEQWRQEPISHPGLRAVAATRFAPRKRVPALLKMLRQVGKELSLNTSSPGLEPAGGFQLEVILAGQGPELGRAQRFIETNGMSHWVKTPGRLSQQGLIDLYRSSDVFLAPGVKDSFSIAGREALVAGLAVLTRSQSGLGEDLQQGIEGASVATDEDMAATLVRWVKDPQQIEAIKEHNRNTPYRYSWDRVIPQTLSLYEEAILINQSRK